MRTLLLLPALALVACGTDSDLEGDAGSSRDTETVATVAVDACDALTADVISSALGLPAAAVALDQEATDMGRSGEYCTYDVESDKYNRVLVRVTDLGDPEFAEAAFSRQYRTATDADLEEVREVGNEAIEEAIAEGEIDEAASGAGEMLSGLMGKFSFLNVEGTGDQAAIEVNGILDPPMPTTIHVRGGVTVYSIEAATAYPFGNQARDAENVRADLTELGRGLASNL
ncbi:hypothetical protein [Rubrivirga sp.]|uniref:hypothetical protein n=1 Tax=Rubrivirga sp. TaxID=1885344 RepID=UPI003C75E655